MKFNCDEALIDLTFEFVHKGEVHQQCYLVDWLKLYTDLRRIYQQLLDTNTYTDEGCATAWIEHLRTKYGVTCEIPYATVFTVYNYLAKRSEDLKNELTVASSRQSPPSQNTTDSTPVS